MNGGSNGGQQSTNGQQQLEPHPLMSTRSHSMQANHHSNGQSSSSIAAQADKDFLCELCGKRFTQKGWQTLVRSKGLLTLQSCLLAGNLKTHIRSVHTKEKPFACP